MGSASGYMGDTWSLIEPSIPVNRTSTFHLQPRDARFHRSRAGRGLRRVGHRRYRCANANLLPAATATAQAGCSRALRNDACAQVALYCPEEACPAEACPGGFVEQAWWVGWHPATILLASSLPSPICDGLFPLPRVAPQSPKAKAAWLRRRPAAAQQPQQKSCNPNRLQFFTSHPSSHPPIHLADTRQCPVLRVIFSLHGPWKFGHSGPVSGCCSVRPLLAAVSWTRGGKGATKQPPSTPL